MDTVNKCDVDEKLWKLPKELLNEWGECDEEGKCYCPMWAVCELREWLEAESELSNEYFVKLGVSWPEIRKRLMIPPPEKTDLEKLHLLELKYQRLEKEHTLRGEQCRQAENDRQSLESIHLKLVWDHKQLEQKHQSLEHKHNQQKRCMDALEHGEAENDMFVAILEKQLQRLRCINKSLVEAAK